MFVIFVTSLEVRDSDFSTLEVEEGDDEVRDEVKSQVGDSADIYPSADATAMLVMRPCRK